jgi:hypothetical protein
MAVNSTLESQEVLQVIMDKGWETMTVERGFPALLEEPADEVDFRAVRQGADREEPFRVSQCMIRFACPMALHLLLTTPGRWIKTELGSKALH